MQDMQPDVSNYFLTLLLTVIGIILLRWEWFYLAGALLCTAGSWMTLCLYAEQVYARKRDGD